MKLFVPLLQSKSKEMALHANPAVSAEFWSLLVQAATLMKSYSNVIHYESLALKGQEMDS